MKKIYELDISSIEKKNCDTYGDLFSLDDDSVSPFGRTKKQFYLNSRKTHDFSRGDIRLNILFQAFLI